MPEAYLVDAVRTPVGRKKGALAGAHPADLGAHVLTGLLARTGVDPVAIEDVVFGCVDTLGPQAGDIARTCWLAAGLPHHVPGVTIDRQCGSAQQAIHFAAQGVMSGTQDLVIAGGVQNMAMVPIGYAMVAGQQLGHTNPFSGSAGWVARYGTDLVNQFKSAEMIAHKWDCSPDDLHAWALRSHERALAAQAHGTFDDEILPYEGITADEGPRPGTTLDKMRTLKPVMEGGRHTAADASQISVGSSAILVASAQAVKDHGLTPIARVHHLSVRGDDPIWMLTAPIPATAYALKKTGLSMSDINLVEINEAFASVVLAWLKETGTDPDTVNVHGGAIALGHPLGATGARLMTTMLHELKRSGKRYGLQTMCEGGGQANVTIVERLWGPRMHFALSEEQQALAEAARGFLAGQPGPLSMTEHGQSYDPAVWSALVEEQGWQAITVPEDVGGWGFGLLDLAVVFEEAGRTGTPCPLFGTVALGITAVVTLGDAAQQARWLAPLLEGTTATAALDASVTATQVGDGWHLQGTARRVIDGDSAALVIVPTSQGVFVLDDGLSRTRLRSLDTSRPLADLAIDVTVSGEHRLASADLTALRHQAAVLLAAESVGAADAALQVATDYATVRVQYGKPIGSFQAIQHILADVMVAVEAARAATWYAAAAIDQGLDDVPISVATAKALASDALMLAAGQSIQVHGGVGFTWEHTAHMVFKRARASRDLLGSPAAHREAVAAAILGGA